MLQISRRAAQIAPSATLAIDTRAKALKAEGKDVVGFGAGEPDFDTPEYVRAAAQRAIDEGRTRYTPVPGTLSLRKVIAEKFMKDNGLAYDVSQIIVSSGAKLSIFTALSVLVDDGDEVLIPSPYWVSYPEMVKMVGGVPVFVPCHHEDGFIVRPEEIAKRVTDKTKVLILNSPSNPLGCVIPRKTLEQIAALAVEKQFYVISDEIYEKLIYDGCEHVSIASLGEKIKEQTVVVNGASKAYAMTGWRIGYVAGPRNVISAMSSFQSQATSNPNSIAQYAAMKALQGDQSCVDAMVAQFEKRRDAMVEKINAIPGLSCRKPHGAFYVMMNIRGITGKRCHGTELTGSTAIAEALLEHAHVAVVPGAAFLDEGFCRISYATSMENIEEGLRRIAAFVKELE